MVLELDGGHMDRSCGKWRRITKTKGGNEHTAYKRTKEDYLDWSYLAQELPTTTCYERKNTSQDRSEVSSKTSKQTQAGTG